MSLWGRFPKGHLQCKNFSNVAKGTDTPLENVPNATFNLYGQIRLKILHHFGIINEYR